MLDVGFSFPFGAVTDWVFYPSASSSMVSTEMARDWAFLLPLFGEAVPRRLTFDLLLHFMLCMPCSCLSLPRPLQGQRPLGLLVPPFSGHRAVPGPGAGPRWGCGGG